MSLSEIIIIMAIALILFGPEDLPDIARMLGRIIYEIRKAINDLTSEFEDVVKEPAAMMNKALDDITKPGRSVTAGTKPGSGNLAADDPASEADDPLAQLPSDMVSYEEETEEKGSSR